MNFLRLFKIVRLILHWFELLFHLLALFWLSLGQHFVQFSVDVPQDSPQDRPRAAKSCQDPPQIALRRPKTGSRSDDEAHLPTKILQARLKRAPRRLQTPTWPNLAPSWTPRERPKHVKTNCFCMLLILRRLAT